MYPMPEEDIQTDTSLKSILDNSRDAVCRFNLRKNAIEYLSPDSTAKQVFGWSRDEILSMDKDQLEKNLNTKDLNKIKMLPSLLLKRNNIQLTFAITVPDGNKRKLSGWFVPVWSGSELYAIDCFARPETEEKAGEIIEELARPEYEIFPYALDTLPVILTVLRPDYTVKWCNKEYIKSMGNNTGKLCYESQFNYDRPCKECQAFIPLKTGKPHHWEWTIPNGRTLDIYNFPIKDSDGSPLILEMDIDITERRKAENALKELNEVLEYRVEERNEEVRKSKVDLENAQRIGNIGNWRLDLKTNNLFWSEENYKIFGIQNGTKLDYSKFLEYIHPDDREFVDKSYKAALLGKEYEIEHRIIAGKNLKWIRVKAFLESDEGGNIIAAFGISQDVTSRRLAEDRLKESEARLRLALESGNIGTWEWDIKSDHLSWDERMEKMYGVPPGWFGGKYDDFEALIHEEDVAHFRKALDDSLRFSIPFETIFRVRYGKKKIKYISAKAQLKTDRNGRPILLSGVCFDITNLKEGTENLISRLNQELLRSNKELESFAYVASHDLQEPLRMITSFTQLLELHYGDKLDTTAKEYIEYATAGAKRMYELINSLLAYSRINKKEIDFKKVDINNVLDTVSKNLALKIREKQVKLTADPLPHVYGDQDQMVHLFQNLISNGIKFSRENPEIIVSSKISKHCCTFSISDNGIGIDRQYFDKIFQIFQRLHQREKYEGTGIGLAICKRIVERHGGRIWIESQPGNGSTFFFTLPSRPPVSKKHQ